MVSQPIKWHGGKNYLASRIVALMPRHRHYVEPFAGGLAVLLARDPNDKRLWISEQSSQAGVSEVVNDINGELTNFWRTLQAPETFARFVRCIQATPLSRAEWEAAAEPTADPVERACRFFIRCRQSRAGQFKCFTSLTRSRTRRGINGNASEWLGAVEGLAAIHARLAPVVIENIDAVKLIRREDTPGTLFYCDPPYLHETRTSKDAYDFELTTAQHQELLVTLKACKGKVMVSGYPSVLYDIALAGWTRHEFDLPNHAAGGERKRRMTEVLWCNFESNRGGAGDFF
jgi:DNA adenine methylase